MTSQLLSTSEFALSSLETLNNQITHLAFPTKNDDGQDTLRKSFLQMRDLLLDAQVQFTKMEDTKRLLAAKIDVNLQQTNEQVMTMKAELRQLSRVTKPPTNSEGKTERIYSELAEMEKTKRENVRLTEELEKTRIALLQARELNQRLTNNNDATAEQRQLKTETIQLKQELSRSQEQIRALKVEQKRLRMEKLDLLGQMRQLYGTLEDKESELRNFISNYEQRLVESENIVKQTANELKQRNDALQMELNAKEAYIDELKQKIDILSRQESLERLSKDSLTEDSLRSNGLEVEPTSLSSLDTLSPCQTSPFVDERIEQDKGNRKVTWSIRNRSGLLKTDDRDVFYASNESQDGASNESAIKQTTMESPLSHRLQMFSDLSPDLTGNFNSFLSDEENVRILSESKALSPLLWKANHVRAWLDLEVHMPGYGKACSENIRSGRVLLSLSDSELNSFLGLQSYLHRRKLRLAIDELRQTQININPFSTVTPSWVANYWLPSLGLKQFGSTFEAQLVDGRLLNVLTKKDLEKYLSVLQKLHQNSIICGIKLLKSLSFDAKVLTDRRSRAKENNNDLIVWTNEQVIEWVKSIDLTEYAENLQNSGVHGGLFVLDSNLIADILTKKLNIPSSKVPVIRHLSTELKLLLANTSANVGGDSSIQPKKSSLTRSPFIRSFRGGKSSADDLNQQNRGSEKSFTLRGSLGRAFSKKLTKDQIRVIRSDQSIAITENREQDRLI